MCNTDLDAPNYVAAFPWRCVVLRKIAVLAVVFPSELVANHDHYRTQVSSENRRCCKYGAYHLIFNKHAAPSLQRDIKYKLSIEYYTEAGDAHLVTTERMVILQPRPFARWLRHQNFAPSIISSFFSTQADERVHTFEPSKMSSVEQSLVRCYTVSCPMHRAFGHRS